MIYEIKSQKSLEEIREMLESQTFTLTYKNDNEIEVHVESDSDFDEFTNTVAFYLSHAYFRDYLHESLVNSGLSKKEAERIVKQAMLEASRSTYYYTFTRILVKEYFKTMTCLKIESFYLFNMKGYKEEIKRYAQRLVNFHSKNGSYFSNEENAKEGYRVDTYFEIMREEGKKNGLKIADFKEIHVHQLDNRLYIENKNGETLDKDFLFQKLGIRLDFKANEVPLNPELFEGMVLCCCLIDIFDVSKVVLHRTLTKEAKDLLVFNINSIKKQRNKRIKIIMCNGCEQCV
ncbi:hypothetical protein PP175_27585 (plasmid) [Aneurinibacillus sp. Ricciae_BoGa-3]|uniref:hypothetical protein n=1 Tax=Aneurinibacillus sp. Ricciae_BoGa-3 TaxID=3022697 RepID=UPI00234011D4|nr:hypothetical protein [Aneurinibacillus sp. Ricciae_BoGa-3]WCK56956.1 hypothetical protein PP175_27585 [Aneurinibacillus sp. Ricciae_BoGa-3]